MGVKLFIIAGHGAGDPGAGGQLGGQWYDEAERVRLLASRIKERGGDEVELLDFSRNAYYENGLAWYDIPRGAQVVELHMDSAPGARGGHVIIQEDAEPDGYDEFLAARIGAMFPGRANTLVGRHDLQNPNSAFYRGLPYRLVENGFISSPDDLRVFNEHLDELADIYLEGAGIIPSGACQPDENIRWMQRLATDKAIRLCIEAPIQSCLYDGRTRTCLIQMVQRWMQATGDHLD